MLHIVFRQIQGYLEPRLVQACHVSGIFSHIYNVRHIEACLPTFEFRHIQDPCITGSSNVKQHLLFKSGSSFKYCSYLFGTFFDFFSKVNIPHFPLQDSSSIMTRTIIIVCYPRQHATHTTLASMPIMQPWHPCYPRQHVSRTNTPPMPTLQASYPCHYDNMLLTQACHLCHPYQHK